MKIFKYIIISLILFLGLPFVSYSQTEVLTTPQTEEKKLSAEELAHLEHQARIDKAAVENANNVRGVLRSISKKINEYSPSLAEVMRKKYLGFMVIQMIAAAVMLAFAFVLTKFIFGRITKYLASFFSRSGDDTFVSLFIRKISYPLNVCTWVLAIYFALVLLIRKEENVALVSRGIGIIFWTAVFWAFIVFSDTCFMALANRLKKRSAAASVNLIKFLRKVFKCLIVIIAILIVLTNCGLNVNTLVASLGIGGMAIAFASQETIANFFGSVSIIIDRPFIVGDWIKTPTCEGNVEMIGFRSTRIRTFTKTVVVIPNSILAKENIENFSKMPVRKVTQVIGLTYNTTADQIEKFLPELCKTIETIDGVDSLNGVSVSFVEFAASSLDIKIIYYTKETSLGYYNNTKQNVNLAIMRLVEAHGLSFAFPSTSVYIEKQA